MLFSINWKENFYAFTPFALINRVLQKIEQDQSQGIIIVALWTTQVWFSQVTSHVDRLSNYSSKGTKDTVTHSQSRESTSSPQETYPPGMQIIRNSLTTRGILEKAAKVILQSWRGSTQKQYSAYLKK